jgi:osmotically-inducible protein OsmY
MKSNRLFAVAALFGAISFAMPPAHADDHKNSIVGGAKKVYEGGEADLKDVDLTSKIETALAIDPITKGATIHVYTESSIVTLSGDVPSTTVIEEANQVAKSVENVKLVLNNLKIENVSNASFEM